MAIKITFLGDIMCEPRLLKAARVRRDEYDFSATFSNVKRLLSEADCVVGNLETPLAGKEAQYVHSLFSFNAPDCFALAAKEAGIDIMLTANNHCLDRGLEGLKRTVQVLDDYGIPHAGSFKSTADRGNTYVKLGSLRIAILSYTYGTNYSANRILLTEGERGHVNLLRPQEESYYVKVPVRGNVPFVKRAMNKVLSLLPEEHRYVVRKGLHMTVNRAHADDNLMIDTMEPYMLNLKRDIEEAKEKADYAIFCPHVGGQFNRIPGPVSKYVFDYAVSRGVDAVVASHAHVVQAAERIQGVPCFFSLGNFSMSPNSAYLIHDDLPDYGIAAHLYFGEKAVEKASFSILKIIEDDCLRVIPVDEYAKQSDAKHGRGLEADVKRIYNTVTGRELQGPTIQREYVL